MIFIFRFFRRRRVKLVILIALSLGVGYILGCLLPWRVFSPTIIPHEIDANDYYTRLVSLVGAAATLCAALVALFKEDLRRLFENARLAVIYREESGLCEVLDLHSADSNSLIPHHPMATRYELVVTVRNHGRLLARGCQIHLHKIEYKGNNQPVPEILRFSQSAIAWHERLETQATIPARGRVDVQLFEILSPSTQIVEASQAHSTDTGPRLRIAGQELRIASGGVNGTFRCCFCIYSENAPAVDFEIGITWDGQWKSRLTEMMSHIVVKPENCAIK